MTASQHEVAEKVRSLVEAGASISGSAAGASLGFILGGPVGAGFGAGVGAYLSHALRSVGDEISDRQLGPRERTRLGAALAFAAKDVQERLKKGEQPRNDGFFDPDASGRSTAEEITEGVMRAAQQEHEEKKIKYLGQLLAEVSFNRNYDRSQCNFLISLAERLTYMQYVIISVIGWNTLNQDRMQLKDTPFSETINDPHLVNLLTQILELINLLLVEVKGTHVLWVAHIIPADLRLRGVGAHLWNTLKVQQLRWDVEERRDFEYVWKLLRREGDISR